MALHYEKPSGSTPPPSADVLSVRALIAPHGALEDTLPPTPLRELLASSGASAFVLTNDTALVDVVVKAAGEQYPVSVVESWSELNSAVVSGQCGIALLDASLIGDRAVECIAALAPYSHRLVTLVAADRSSAAEFVGLLADRRIHRLLMKPAAVGATRLLIESAVTRRMALRDLHPEHEAVVEEPVVPAHRPRRAIGVAAGVALALVAAVVAYLRWPEPATAPAIVGPPVEAIEVADPAAALRQRLDDLRAQAELARAEGRLSEPLGAGALEHYLAILALAPDDAAARNGVVLVVESLFTRAEQGLLSGALEDVASSLDQVRRVQPESTRLKFLDAQLVRALTASTAAAPSPPAPQPTSVAGPTELESTLTLAAARIRRGQLVSPAGDNAREYLDRARELDPTDARATTLRAELASALVTAARLVLPADLAAAGALAAEARRQNSASPELAAFEEQLTAARAAIAVRQNSESLVVARELMRQGALFAPPGNHALGALLRIQGDAPDTEGLTAAWSEFRVAARSAIEVSAAAADWPTVEASLSALREAPEGAVIADQLSSEFAARRLQERYLAEVIPATELKLLSSVPAAYPMEMLNSNIEGWVDIEFIVDRTGQTRDGVVVDARPRGSFNAAALAALKQYRFAPFELDGRLYERRARLRIRFVIR